MSSKVNAEKGVAPPSAGALTYNSYLKVDELKLLQICQSDPAHHDEPLFIIIHQTYELWFKLILHEIDTVFEQLSKGKVRRATFYMRRVIAIMKLLVQQIHILETMSPRDFLGFRYNLSPASGYGSSQFREIEIAAGLRNQHLLDHFADDPVYPLLKKRLDAPTLEDAFYAVLEKNGFNLPRLPESAPQEQRQKAQDARLRELTRLYMDEDKHGDLHDFAEALIEFDELLYLWRSNHVIVVERMIGNKRGTGGSEGVGYLQTTLSKRCFPDLWNVRTVLEQPDEAMPRVETQGDAPDHKPAGGGCPFS